ncbi:MAG TPA: hypothetical protein VKU85_11960 [bacterium]|nr:hypothetical protein [bacterium]
MALAGLAASLAGCGGQEAYSARHAVLVCLGPDRGGAGCYGEPAARTPGLDRLARQGASFLDVATPSPDPALVRQGLLTGFHPWEERSGEITPARACRETGWRTAAFVRPAGMDAAARDGFDPFRAVGDDGDPVEDALAWLDDADPEAPFLLFAGLDGDGPLVRLLRGLERGAHLRRTLVLVTGAGGGPGTGGATDVPLVAWGPFPFRGGGCRPDLARTLDVMPTLLDALRVGTKANRPGRALQRRLKAYKEAALVALARGGHEDDDDAWRSIRVGSWKYVAGHGEALFDLATDPGQRHDLRQREPEKAAELRAALDTAFREG